MGRDSFKIYAIAGIFIFCFTFIALAEPEQKLIDFSLMGFDKQGAKSMELTGKSADIFTENIELEDVTAKLEGKDDNLVIKADKGNFNKTKNSLELKENVRAEVLNNQNTQTMPREVIITSSGPLEIDYKNKKAIFRDNVVVDRPDSKMFSDKLEIFFDGPASKISHIIALDNVKIVRDENISYCQQADFDMTNDKLVLSGEPKLILNETPRD